MLAEVDEPDFRAQRVAREVDDDVVALGDALFVELGEDDRRGQQIAVVADLDHRRSITQCELEEPRDAGIEDPEAVLARLDLAERLVTEVDGHRVADETVEVEDVEIELAVAIPGL